MSVLAEPDWSTVPEKEIPMFYPGPSAYEWVTTRRDHSGAKKLQEGKQNCFDCHEADADVIGLDVVAGKKVGKAKLPLDATVPPGARGTFPLRIKAAHDDTRIFLRFEWAGAPPASVATPASVDEIKLSMMFDDGHNEAMRLNGCWVSCHLDLRSMPDAADGRRHPLARALGWRDGVTKYLPDSRTTIRLDEAPRGGWKDLQKPAAIRAGMREGRFLDLIQYRSASVPPGIDGHVFESRRMSGGRSLLRASGTVENGHQVVVFERLLRAGGPGDHTIGAGTRITFGISVHEDFRTARFHHVSLGYTLGLDDPEAFINAVHVPAAGQPAAARPMRAPAPERH
jgi:cytochrome c-type protein NapC